MKFFKVILFLSPMVLLVACMPESFKAENYTSYTENSKLLAAIKKKSMPIAIKTFRDIKENRKVICKLTTIGLPNKISYSDYLQDALVTELKRQNLYSVHAKKQISVTVNEVDFSSGLIEGEWKIIATFNDHHQSAYVVSDEYKFPSSWESRYSCGDASKAFSQAVQQFINTLFKNKYFIKTLVGY